MVNRREVLVGAVGSLFFSGCSTSGGRSDSTATEGPPSTGRRTTGGPTSTQLTSAQIKSETQTATPSPRVETSQQVAERASVTYTDQTVAEETTTRSTPEPTTERCVNQSVDEETIEVVETETSWSDSGDGTGTITATTTLRNPLEHPVSFQLYVTFKTAGQWGESVASFVDIKAGVTVQESVEKDFPSDERPSEYAVQIVNPETECS